MHITVSLTVAESKRLIAKGLVASRQVQTARDQGILAVAPGTTNGYVVEELLGEAIDKPHFVTGNTLPFGYQGTKPGKSLPDLVFRRGERLEMSAVEAVQEMGPGDVFIKGVNAINYDLDQAGVLIGHPTGGTLGAVLGTIVARRIQLIHPVGLEKSIPGDLTVAAAMQKEADGMGPTLWVSPGRLFTEIEALAVLCEVEAVPIGAGGIGGAEGAVWLLLRGDEPAVEDARKLLAGLRGEPAFLGPA